VFEEKSIPEEAIKEILTAGTMAPSSGNMQPWEFVVIENPEMKAEIVKFTFSGYYSKGANHQNWIQQAGIIIVACANVKRTVARYGESGKEWAMIDVAACVENMFLTATALGLSGCWVGGFNEQKLKNLLNIPIYVKPIGLLPLGYAGEEAAHKTRISLKWVTHKNQYNTPYFKHDGERGEQPKVNTKGDINDIILKRGNAE